MHNKALHDMTLIRMTIAGFVGTGGVWIINSNRNKK